ncbi:calcium-binding protein [Kluyvera sichuanensis]
MEDYLSSKNLFSESKKSFSPRDFIESLFNEIGSAIQQIDYSNRGTAAALGTDPDAGVGKSINSLAKIFDVVNGVLSPGILYNKVINGEDTIDDWVNTTASIASGLVAVGIAGPEIAAVVTALSVYNFVSGLGIGKRLGQVMAQGIIDRIYNHGLKNPDTGELLLPPHNGDGSTRTPDPNGDPANAISPIILDLDGDGIETLSTQDGVNFDHDGNAFAENSGWVSRDDGLLVLDRNNDGAIDTGNELFGSNTRLKDGSYAENGYLALQELDDNNDGLINSEDAIWAQLNVWQDKNGDARVDEGELLTLDELGIASISTQYNQSSYVDDNGNAHKQMGEMTMSDGTVRQSTDVWFNVNPGSTTYGDDIVIPESVRQLPYIRGFGNIASLHVAMTENPELRLLVEQYIADPLSENAYALLEEIVFTWAGVSDIAVDSRGQYIDARHLATIEAASGENYQSKTNGTVDPRINAAALLDEQYKKFVSYIESRLLSQTLYAEDFALVKLTINKDLTGFALDFEAFEQHLDSLKSTDFGRFLKISNILYNMLEYEPLLADVRQRIGISGEFLSGSSEDDVLDPSGAKNYILWGNEGDDYLAGAGGNDVIAGGKGNDTLHGGSGNDTYLFNLGDGQDLVRDAYSTSTSNSDTLIFGEGLLAQNARLTHSGNNLVISFEGSDDCVTIVDYFFYDALGYRVERFVFADGTTWDEAAVKAMLIAGTDEAQTLIAHSEGSEIHGLGGNDTLKGNSGDDKLYGDEGNDTLTGSSGNDALYGGAGNDSLDGGNGDDVLLGGEGNDWMAGGSGSDTYLFNLGDGQDTITDGINDSGTIDMLSFGDGLLAQNARLTHSGNNLVISFEGSEDRVTVTNYFYASRYQIESIVFNDGTVWDVATVKAMLIAGTDEAQTLIAHSKGSEIHGLGGNDTLKGDSGDDKLYGDEGNDSLDGGRGNDLLHGGAGNDTLMGYTGSDTYLFNSGDGQDTISDSYSYSGDSDTLRFGEGLLVENARLTRSGNHLVISFEGSDDRVTVTDYFYSSRYQVEHISFADGTDWLPEDILNYMEDDIPLPLAASADAPVSLQLIREQMVAFTGGDDDAEDSVGDAMPTLSTSRSSVSALMHF